MATIPTRFTATACCPYPSREVLIGYEFVDGPVPVVPATRVHGRLIIRIGHGIEEFVRERGLAGEVLDLPLAGSFA